MQVSERTTCRVCGSADLKFLFTLGDQYVSNFLDKGESPGQRVPIRLQLCNKCTLVQLQHTAPQEILYSRYYWYRSGVTQTMYNALRDITRQLEDRVDLKPSDVVLDIGSNDGTLLRSYEKACYKVGVEPAKNLAEEGAEGVDCFINDFWDADKYFYQVGAGAKVITAIGMFYDLEDPNKFIAGVADSLRRDGIFVAQLMCLKNMIDLHDVGNFAHEHLEYYSFASLQYLYEKHGLKIIDIETNDVNGRSYRIWARLKGGTINRPKGAERRIAEVQSEEEGLDQVSFYHNFFNQLQENRKKIRQFILDAVAEGKTVWVYGASTKGNVILQYYGLDSTVIKGASDRSPEKWGKFTVGTGIEIFSEAIAREANPDYFLVLPYAFLDEFMIREKKWRDGGGKFIVPLPELRVV